MSWNCKVDGLGEIEKLFKELEDNEVKEALDEIGKEARTCMRKAIVVDTGKSKKSIKRYIKKADGGLKLVVRVTERYFGFQEFGSKKARPENISRLYKATKHLDEKALEILTRLVTQRGE